MRGQAGAVRNRPQGQHLINLLNGTDRSRTDDLLRVKQALFQLSYDPKFNSCSLLWFATAVKNMSGCFAKQRSLLLPGLSREAFT